MKRFYRNNIYFFIAIPVLLISVGWEIMSLRSLDPENEAQRICKVLENQETKMEKEFSSLMQKVKGIRNPDNYWYLLNPGKYNNEDRAYSISKNNNLIYWSSSMIAFPQEDKNGKASTRVVRLPTGWFLMKSKREGEYTFRGYILIKREFPYKNKYIHNAFQEDFRLSEDYPVRTEYLSGGINIKRSNGEFLFSIVPIKGGMDGENNNVIIILYLFLLFLLMAQTIHWLVRNHYFKPEIKFLISIVIGITSYFILNRLRIPVTFYQSELFTPREFAYGEWLSSLGEFLFISLFIFYIAQSFFTLFRLDFNHKEKNKAVTFFVFLFTGFYFCFSVFLLKILLLNSNITLEFFSNLQLSFINLISFLCISLHTLGFVIIIIRLRAEYLGLLKFRRVFLYLAGAFIIANIVFMSAGMQFAFLPFLYYLIISTLLILTTPEKIRRYKFTFLLFISIISATYLNIYSHELIVEKKNNVQKLLAVNLSSERDPTAEIFLTGLEDKFKADTLAEHYLYPPYGSVETYFRNHYFTGFWRNYDLKITVCSPLDSLLFEGVNLQYPCYDFFKELQSANGVLIPGSNFYFMDRLNGRISYLGELNHGLLKIFIDLNSKILPEGSGYPELLLDEKTSRESRNKGFSYAKYFEGKLVDRGGDFQYEIHLPREVSKTSEFHIFTRNSYNHCSYHSGGNNYIVVSYPEPKFVDQVKTFPYLFLLVYLIGLLVVAINQPTFRIKRKPLDFRGKIQLTLILSLLGTSTLVGLGLIFYNYNQFRHSLQEDLNEKLHSISSELSMRIGPVNQLDSRTRDMLNDQLISISDITRTDINLYSTKGVLFATSRNEIFDRGLNSKRIDPTAFHALYIESKTQFIHNENLGMMSFFSAYIPVYNDMNDLVGYLNLPYFTRQDEFKKEVSAFIITFSNVYILLILISLIIALFIANKLTLPLLKIENNLKGIQLGKVNTKIEYLGEDEIGRLAKEYNKKVDELAESAALLARTERELAWREMARQVAHEINNPLTPMKLNIQYLRRIKEQGSENFDEYFDQVSKTLIENIDVLSSIASSFSDFARMPKIESEALDLRERLNEAVLLFNNTPHVTINIRSDEKAPVQIIADKNQFSRVLINLIKNGIQSIPGDKEGIILIELKKDEHYAFITIADNGTGIPTELRPKLFEPSFTTKSSGMGLGLAIAKRIIEHFKGEIWFQTSMDEGTTFYIKLPLAREEGEQ